MSEMENNEMMVNTEENYVPEEESSNNGTWLLVAVGAGCAALGYGIKSGVDAIRRHRAAKKEETKEDKPKKERFKLFKKKETKSDGETKETEKKADEAKAKEEES